MNCNVRIPVAGVLDYYIEATEDEESAKDAAMKLAKADCRLNGRRFELEAYMTLQDASYQEIEIDDIEYDDDDHEEDDDSDDEAAEPK